VTDQQQATSVATELAARIRGDVLSAGDPGYDQARTPHFGFRTGHPVAVVRPANATDVAAVVDTASRTGLPLHVRGGGHHAAGHSTGDGVLVDLGSLTGIDLEAGDVAGPSVWAGAGLTAGALTTELAGHGLAVGFGDTGSVGIGGITLSGGIGFLSRRYGMTIDNLLGAEIVTADGRVRLVDAEHQPELFWALRGGGGNFGIVTRFRYRAVPVSQVYGGALFLPATAQALRRVVAASVGADDRLSVIASVLAMPPMDFVPAELHGRPVIMARLCYTGDPDRGEQAVAPLRQAASPLADLVGPMPYPALFAEPPPSHGAVVAVRNMFLTGVDGAAAETVVGHLDRSAAWLRMVQFRALGGAIGRVDPAATAFAHRKSPVMVTIACNAQPDLEAARAWTEELAGNLQQRDQGAYIGFFGPHDGDRIENAYPPDTLERLRGIKAAYDPGNLFRHNDNIAPVTTDGTSAPAALVDGPASA
jgi:FAD/FMN-containing dehydrogenase